MTRGQERCLYLLPVNEFRRLYEQIKTAPIANKKTRDYLRMFLSGAVDQVPDKQGRLQIPKVLRDYANLNTELAVIGAGTRVEIWNLEAWTEYLKSNEDGYADATEEILPAIEF
jgi:MraZ protein